MSVSPKLCFDRVIMVWAYMKLTGGAIWATVVKFRNTFKEQVFQVVTPVKGGHEDSRNKSFIYLSLNLYHCLLFLDKDRGTYIIADVIRRL